MKNSSIVLTNTSGLSTLPTLPVWRKGHDPWATHQGVARTWQTTLFSVVGFALLLIGLTTANGWGQVASQGTAGPPLATVDGEVINVYRALDESPSYVVQILVQRSAAERIDDIRQGIQFPAPGECVYVQLQPSVRGGSPQLPRPGVFVRASLQKAANHVWSPAGANWLVETGLAEATDLTTAQTQLGLTTETVALTSGDALRVVAVTPSSPAAQAGFEVGDILVDAAGARLSRPEQLDAAIRRTDGKLSITVRDIRTGKNVPVEVQWDADMRANEDSTRRADLGVTGELAFLSGEEVVKVTQVAAQSPAARAGLAPGWLILSVDGIPATSPDRLTELVRAAAVDRVVLEVHNPDNNQRRTVRVDLGGGGR